MNKITLILFVALVYAIGIYLGELHGIAVERNRKSSEAVSQIPFDSQNRINTYNEIMLRNCLKKK